MNEDSGGITIRHLADVPEIVPVLARWFVEEWEPYYGPDGPGEAEVDLRQASARDQLPICLVAFSPDGDVAGTIALKAESVPSHRHLSPWVAAFLVAPERRRQGVGTALITALLDNARRLGFQRIYVAANQDSDAAGLFARHDWRAIDEAKTLRGPVGVYILAL